MLIINSSDFVFVTINLFKKLKLEYVDEAVKSCSLNMSIDEDSF